MAAGDLFVRVTIQIPEPPALNVTAPARPPRVARGSTGHPAAPAATGTTRAGGAG